MDDFQLIRVALDNMRVPEIAANAEQALDRNGMTPSPSEISEPLDGG